jgi:arginyl-tRNA--protein-N-Asp/Glu arginylyltransferase
VYLYYDPDYSFLSLGTLSSLFELRLVRQLEKVK